MKKNVISYSLWGDKKMYWIGALRNIEIAKELFPEFICRFYVYKDCDSDLINSLYSYNTEVIIIDEDEKYEGMFWRFKSSVDEDIDIFLSRDCDSRLSIRERIAIDEWLKSEKDFHIMRDHPYHTVPILGGMWGCRNGLMRSLNLDKLISDWKSIRTYSISNNNGHRGHSINSYGDDQEFLAQFIYPIIKDNAMEHSEFNLKFGGEIRPFPTIRNNYEFVGDVFDENDNRHPDYWKIIKNIIR